MRGFVFKLESVLEQRLNVERQRQCELAEVQREIVSLRDEIWSIECVTREACALQRGRADVRMLAAQARFSATMRQKVTLLRERLKSAEGAQAQAQERLVEAAKNRKVIEKLREKQLAKWAEDERKREELAAEEVQRATS
jgi:flagellar FliJ protein